MKPQPSVSVLHTRLPQATLTTRELRQLREALPAEEQTRFAAIQNARAAMTFLLGRVLMRNTLGSKLACSPSAVPLTFEAGGKPVLQGAADLHFNLSHSRNRIVLAFAQGCAVGIDIEPLRPRPHWERLLDRFYAPAERTRVRAAPDPQEEFIRIWTRKEAYLKATGQGIRSELASLDLHDPEAVPAGWTLQEVPIAGGYLATLCHAHPAPCTVQTHPWQPTFDE